MAQIDTGLGWSARDIGLMSAGHALMGAKANINGVPVPYGQTRADALTSGVYLGNHDYAGNMYAVCNTTCYVVCCPGSSSIMFISPVYNAMVTVAGEYHNYSRTIYLTSGFPAPLQNYYYKLNSGHTPQTINPDIPIYTSYDDLYARFVGQGTNYYKLNSGYAVSCFATWKNTNGETVTAPVLISSNPDYTVISLDNTSPTTYDTFGFLWFGMKFYCSLIVNTPFTPSPVNVDVVDLTVTHPEAMGAYDLGRTLADYYLIQPYIAPDPYEDEGGESGEDGGFGDSDPDDDPVEEETLPLPSVAGLGFCTIYVPTDTDLTNLAAYLWGGNLDLDNFLRLFANPMDSILGLSVVPVSLSGTYSPIYMGGQLLQNITMPKYTGRTSIKVDMGTTTIDERWGSYLDYDPYTELSLYLPFIGIKNIKADDVMGKTISLMYSIDILSGACVAYIRNSGGSVLYEWSGQCALQVPVTGQNWDNIFATAATTAAAIGGALFAPSAVSAGAIASTAVQAIAAKPRVERSGAVNGITGFLGQMRPYLIRVIPQAYIPNDQNKFIGYPSYITANLGSLTGYNEVSSIHLEGIPATGNELAEIETLLKGGVIL